MKNNSLNRINKKTEKEKKIVKLMIIKYCNGHKHLGTPCESCSEIIKYVEKRIDLCPFKETKTYCSNCKVHCYNSNMKVKIKKVMRYSGSRMIFSHPIIIIDHVYQQIKYKLKQKQI